MKNVKLITAGLFLTFFVIALVGLLGLNRGTIEISEGNTISKVGSQTETSVSNLSKQNQEIINIEFRIKPEFE